MRHWTDTARSGPLRDRADFLSLVARQYRDEPDAGMHSSLGRLLARWNHDQERRRIDESLRPGLTFMTLHFQDDVATNLLTIDATDPKSGTAEFKATAIRIEKLPSAVTAR